MTTQLLIPVSNQHSFQFNSSEVRTETIDLEVWWCLLDVTRVLGIKRGVHVAERLNEHGRRKTSYVDAIGRKQDLLFINESNLYKLIFRSNKPEARAFEEWVTGEVLPSIRRTGVYIIPDAPATKEDRKPINSILAVWVGCAPITFREAWQLVHARFGITSVEQLTVSQIQPVVDWIQERIDHACATPRIPLPNSERLEAAKHEHWRANGKCFSVLREERVDTRMNDLMAPLLEMLIQAANMAEDLLVEYHLGRADVMYARATLASLQKIMPK